MMDDGSNENRDMAARAFEDVRPRLAAVAYRMLGSVADAEDAVQDTWVKWQGIDHNTIESADAWLMTSCTRRCIDMLRAAHKSRVDYVGQWLPEPVLGVGLVLGDAPVRPDDHAELASSLTMAFMHVLERLTPVERAAYLLRDVFEYDYADIAFVLDKSETACRQIVSRAKKRVADERVADKRRRTRLPADHQQALLTSFLAALETGNTEALAGIWRKAWKDYVIEPAVVNGTPGALLYLDGQLTGTLSLASDEDGQCARVFVVRNPDKLGHLVRSRA